MQALQKKGNANVSTVRETHSSQTLGIKKKSIETNCSS